MFPLDSRSCTWHISLLLLAAQCSLSSAMRPQGPLQQQWWREPFGMFQTNLREVDADMDVNATADFLQQHGASAWLIGVGGILAHYPTQLDFHARNPYLGLRESGDLVRDALDAARARDIKLLARMDFSKVQAGVADEHPEWLFVSPAGERQSHTNGLVSVCPSAGYYQEKVFEILGEAIARYDFDGFFVNWAGFNENDYFKVYHGVCHCSSCQSRWRESMGDLELPKGREDQSYAQWKNFSNQIVDDWTSKVTQFIHERLPNAGLILGDSADIRFHEANNAVDREFWPHLTTQTVSDLKTFRPEVPILVNSVSFIDMPYRYASEEPAHFAQYLLQSISRGANPSTYIMGYPGRIPYLNFDIASQITRFHRKWKHVYDGMVPVAKTGLLFPASSRMNTSQYEDALSEFRGIYSALQELHVPFDVIGQTRLLPIAESGGLNRYQAIILPHIGKLRPDEASALDKWVTGGGRLIATGSSGVEDDGHVQLQALPSQRQRHVVGKRELLWSLYFAPPQNNSDAHSYTGPMIPVHGSYHVFDWKNGTQGRYHLIPRAPFAPPEYAYGHVASNEIGTGIRDHGRGKGIAIPFTIGRGYRELGLRVFRDFFGAILDEDVQANEKVAVDISEQVEVTINANGPKTVLHFINMSGVRKQNFGSHLAIPAGSIRVAGANVTAHALLSDRLLEWGNGSIELPALDLFEVVVIEGLD